MSSVNQFAALKLFNCAIPRDLCFSQPSQDPIIVISTDPRSKSVNIMVGKCQALLHPQKSRLGKHLNVGPRDRASAVPSATGRRTLATFGSAIVAGSVSRQ